MWARRTGTTPKHDWVLPLVRPIKTRPHSAYAKANLFVGKYTVPEDGHVRLDAGKVRFLWGHQGEMGWQEGHSDDIDSLWLVVEDGSFWPVMVEMNVADISRMLAVVREAFRS